MIIYNVQIILFMITLCLLFLIFMIRLFHYEDSCKKVGDMGRDKISVLLNEYGELRDELKQRITQRDSFSIQFVIAIIAIITIACSGKYTGVIFLLPIISYYFTEQIYSSYVVHERLVEFIRENIENRIADELGVNEPSDVLWESYCHKVRKYEIDDRASGRKKFFEVINLLIPFVSLVIYFGIKGMTTYSIVGAAFCLVCFGADIKLSLDNHRQKRYVGLNKLSFADYVDPKPRTDEITKAIFFDRDGTLHVDKVMTHRCKDLELLPGTKELVKTAHERGFKVIVVTNQSAIGKGYYSINQMHRFNRKLRRQLKYVDAIYFCPHTADVHCRCRKPSIGMFERAVKEFNIDLEQSIIVGDRMSDIRAGANAGIGRKIFVTTGIYGDGGYEAENGFFDIEHETVNSLFEIELEN